jgi:hypothetical protein
MLSATTMPNDWAQTRPDALAYLQDQLPWQAQTRPSRTERMSVSDEECMASYRRGDAEAFRILYQRYRGKLHRYVLRLSNRPSEAEEVFQDIWISVINGKDRSRDRRRRCPGDGYGASRASGRTRKHELRAAGLKAGDRVSGRCLKSAFARLPETPCLPDSIT